ncbi:MAG: TAXI family TRAP transporter solute-binding subunit [Actinomycetaceae bacterium]|nr:TAXI family TRAP transporter solute-binding subunit [Actinomycetaceae bacterium]
MATSKYPKTLAPANTQYPAWNTSRLGKRHDENDLHSTSKVLFGAVIAALLLLSALFFMGSGNSSQQQTRNQSQSQAPSKMQAPAQFPSQPQPATIDRSQTSITMLTGPSSGIYYPVGSVFSWVLSDRGYNSMAIATGASRENILSILTGKGDLAITMIDNAILAIKGEGAWAGMPKATELRAIMGLWPDVVQIVTTADSGIKSFTDLRGRHVSVGAPGSGTDLNARMIFEAHGMSYSDINVDFFNIGEAIDKIANGRLDAAFVTSGLGNAAIRRLGEIKKLAFVPVEGEVLQYLLQKYPMLSEHSIPADVYGTDAPTTTAAVMNIMLAAKKLPDDVVYDILDSFYSEQGLEIIRANHPLVAKELQLSTALRGIQGTPIRLHPGAEKFYREMGVGDYSDNHSNDVSSDVTTIGS